MGTMGLGYLGLVVSTVVLLEEGHQRLFQVFSASSDLMGVVNHKNIVN